MRVEPPKYLGQAQGRQAPSGGEDPRKVLFPAGAGSRLEQYSV